jgi:hypothetical protein
MQKCCILLQFRNGTAFLKKNNLLLRSEHFYAEFVVLVAF